MAGKKMGRPSPVDDRLKHICLTLAKEGKTLAQIAATIKVSRSTLYLWMGKDKNFSDAIKEAATMADDLVEMSLFRRATGYSHPEEKIFCQDGQIVRARTIKHYAPSEVAQIFWLKNRQPDRWREKPTDDADTDKPIKLDYDDKQL